MDDKIEELVLFCSSQLPACYNLLSSNTFKQLAQMFSIKILLVDDEHTKNMLLSANVTTLPLLIMKIGEDILEVKKSSYILKVLEDLKNKKVDEEPEIQKPLFSAQTVYKTDDFVIFYISCDKFTTNDNFDLTIVSENCRKVHFENDNHVVVNATNVNSLKKIVPLLDGNIRTILTVSRTKRLADLVFAMCMFYLQQSNIDEIQNATSLSKKTLMDLLDITEDLK
jgi:hypothetical protein